MSPSTLLARGALALLAVAFVAAVSESDHTRLPHRFVRIGSGGLHPKVQSIESGEAFGWLNYAGQIGRVSFDREVGKKLLCKWPGAFRVTGERLESRDIQARQFASLCQLAPGEYDYRVELFGGPGAAGGVPTSVFEGKLVVQ